MSSSEGARHSMLAVGEGPMWVQEPKLDLSLCDASERVCAEIQLC